MGRIEGKAVFVPFAAPGDVVDVEVTEKHKAYDYAEIKNIIEPAGCRVKPQCKYFGRCGGCHLQHINYATQILWKQLILEEQLSRIAKIKDPPVLPTVNSPTVLKYRSRIQVHREDSKIGFFEGETNRVIDIDSCPVADPEVNKKLKAVREEWPVKSDKLEISISGQALFSQINPYVNGRLKRLVVEWAKEGPHDAILELYAGSGNLTFELAKFAKKIAAVESDKQAVDEGIKTAQDKGIDNVEFVATTAEEFLKPPLPLTPTPTLSPSSFPLPLGERVGGRERVGVRGKYNLVLLDPPRDGLSKKVVTGITKLKPARILYVSCNPSTLARDIKLFIKAGYKLERSQPLDMFPQTYHIESITELAYGENKY